MTTEFDSVEFQAASYGLVISVVLASIYSENHQARLMRLREQHSMDFSNPNCRPIEQFLSVNFEPPFLYKFSFDVELAPPILMLIVVYWNSERNDNLE